MRIGDMVEGQTIVAAYRDLFVLTEHNEGFSIWNLRPDGRGWGEKRHNQFAGAMKCFADRCVLAVGKDMSYERL